MVQSKSLRHSVLLVWEGGCSGVGSAGQADLTREGVCEGELVAQLKPTRLCRPKGDRMSFKKKDSVDLLNKIGM